MILFCKHTTIVTKGTSVKINMHFKTISLYLQNISFMNCRLIPDAETDKK